MIKMIKKQWFIIILALVMAVVVGLCYAVFGFMVGQGLYKLGVDDDRRTSASER